MINTWTIAKGVFFGLLMFEIFEGLLQGFNVLLNGSMLG